MKAYSIKYVGTKGIIEREGIITGDARYFTDVDGRYTEGTKFHEKIGRDVFFERHVAVEAARKKLERKIASLKGNIKRLEQRISGLK